MKKNHGFPYKWGIKMRYVLLVIQVALFLPQWGHASNNVLLPGPKIRFSMKDALMKDVIWELEKRSGFVFAYNANDLLKAGKVTAQDSAATEAGALKRISTSCSSTWTHTTVSE